MGETTTLTKSAKHKKINKKLTKVNILLLSYFFKLIQSNFSLPYIKSCKILHN